MQVQRSDKVGAPGLVNFISAVANHFCPACLQHSHNLEQRLLLTFVHAALTSHLYNWSHDSQCCERGKVCRNQGLSTILGRNVLLTTKTHS